MFNDFMNFIILIEADPTINEETFLDDFVTFFVAGNLITYIEKPHHNPNQIRMML